MSVELGTTLRCYYPPRHIWIVLSKPEQNDGKFLFVNLTTVGGSCQERACVLTPADYSDLDGDSTVAYSRSHVGNVSALEEAIQKGLFTPLNPLPGAALTKVIEAAKTSPHVSAVKRALLP